MSVISLFNIGKRTWLKCQNKGLLADLGPGDAQEIEEIDARRLVMAYPKDFSLVGRAVPSTAEIERREQSLRDRESNLARREADLVAREKAVKEKETEISSISLMSATVPAEADLDGAPTKGKPGRKPKAVE
jgi:hypothetical protein